MLQAPGLHSRRPKADRRLWRRPKWPTPETTVAAWWGPAAPGAREGRERLVRQAARIVSAGWPAVRLRTSAAKGMPAVAGGARKHCENLHQW